jgi:hypothetical protein
MTHHLFMFDSLEELLDHASQPPTLNEFYCASRYKNRENWSGTATFEDAVALGRHGWSDVRPQIDGVLAEVDSKVRSLTVDKPVMFHDVTGAFVDVGAYLSGEPECMIEVQTVPVPATGRIVRLLVNTAFSWSTDESTVRARGAAICALIDAFARQQLAIEVYVECTIRPPHGKSGKTRKVDADRLTTLVKVKAAADPLDIDLLMFPIGHVAFLRRIVFDSWERLPDKTRRPFGLGDDTPSSSYGLTQSAMMKDVIKADIVLASKPGYDSPECNDPAAWVTSCMKNMGLQLQDW